MVQGPESISTQDSPDILGSLSVYESLDSSPHIGTVFSSASFQLSSLLSSDIKIRDLATLIAHRGVVFFPEQDITIEQQKQLGLKLSRLGAEVGPGKGRRDEKSGLHRHPISEETPELAADVSVITSKG